MDNNGAPTIDSLSHEIRAKLSGVGETPVHVFLEGTSSTVFAEAAALVAEASTNSLRLRAAYSVKTNPRAELLALARQNAFCAEVISLEELGWAARNGFATESMIYNGPGPLSGHAQPVHVAFADSIVAFKSYAQKRVASVVGIRLRPGGIVSRFGVAREEFDDLISCAAEFSGAIDLGVSFHVRPEDYAGQTWQEITRNVIESANEMEHRCGCCITVLDLGGGWTPDSFRHALRREVPQALRAVRSFLPHVREVFLEPGQALATPCVVLYSRVIEIRKRKTGAIDAVIDASINDAPHIAAYAHRILASADESFSQLSFGEDRILGSTCLEYDILAPKIALPPNLQVGDRIAIADCGSYDSSMAFTFARGAAPKNTYGSLDQTPREATTKN
ncbi:MAG: hypothetical protein M3Z14_03745 [Candidatus Eremiobacteraeota bacterium]|nr:hypothetical protein [Candidatus Eremiobacteraeota bacterium]